VQQRTETRSIKAGVFLVENERFLIILEKKVMFLVPVKDVLSTLRSRKLLVSKRLQTKETQTYVQNKSGGMLALSNEELISQIGEIVDQTLDKHGMYTDVDKINYAMSSKMFAMDLPVFKNVPDYSLVSVSDVLNQTVNHNDDSSAELSLNAV